MSLKPRYFAVSAVCLAIALFCLAYPVYVIRPFRYQGGRELQVALFTIRYRGWAELTAALAGLGAAIGYWRGTRGAWRRAGVVVVTVITVLCAALSRVNIYEMMFRPIRTIAFGPAKDSKLDGDEKVIAIAMGAAARAYPIRSISYHHIVNDTLADVPVAATY